MAFTNYAENKLTDAIFRGQSISFPATIYIGLIVATRGFSSNIRSTAVSVGDTVAPTTPNGRLYQCTTSGTCGSTEPTWGTVAGGTTADGTAVWTEQSVAMEAGTFKECTGTGYARVAITSSLANWAGTQGAGTTVASTGTGAAGGTTSNNAAITFGSPTSQWGLVFGYFIADASTAGNAWTFAALTAPKQVNNGDPAPLFPIASLSFTIT
jgi:hypothetical protein